MNIGKAFVALLFVSWTYNSGALSVHAKLIYPESAVKNCIEGDVGVEYTYSAAGQPINIKITSTTHPGVFEEATLLNLSRWRVPEKAGETESNIIEYRIEDCNS